MEIINEKRFSFLENNSVIHSQKELNEKKEKKERLKETHTRCVIQLTPKTVLEISSKEGREWGFDCTHAATS